MSGELATPPFHRPCWAEINLDAFQHNWKVLTAQVPSGHSFLAVVKANAYGHGLLPIAQAAVKAGAVYLGVSSLEEGIALRESGINAPVLILGSLFPFKNFPVLFDYHLTPTIASLFTAEALSALAVQRNETIQVHVEIDTGMGRTGVSPTTALDLLRAIVQLPGLAIEGLYTHLASADVDPDFSAAQVHAFENVVAQAAAEQIRPKWIHWANSAALFRFPEKQPVLIRPGLTLYGVAPYAAMPHAQELKPVLTWKTRIIFLKNLPSGSSISYARTWTAQRASRIATLAVGYADGLMRLLSNRGRVLIGGRRMPIVGRVTMDMTMVDVTDLESCDVGDEAVLIGNQGEAQVSAGDLAQWAETNPYEILCAISARVPRIRVHG